MSKLLSLDELLAAPRLRTREFDLEGVGTLTIHELPSTEMERVADKARSGTMNLDGWARHALRLLGQPDEAITDEQVAQLRDNLSASAIDALCAEGYRWVSEASDAAKN